MGSIKLGSTSINKMYLGSTEIKKVYLGSTLIWSSTTYSYRWEPIFKNNSVNAEPAFVGQTGMVRIKDSNGNTLKTEMVTIPTKGNQQSASISFTSTSLYSSVTAEFSYYNTPFSTTTVSFGQPSGGIRYGTPISVGFSFD